MRKRNLKSIYSFVFLLPAMLAQPALADWALDNSRSELSFISIKATDIAETHTFGQLQGTISNGGAFQVDINLASVETLIPIRNERMQEFLFETNLFPRATINAALNPQDLAGLSQGATRQMDVDAILTIKDKAIPIAAQVVAARLDDETLLVTSTRPIVLTAASVGLGAGVEKLRELAGLSNISQAVPVSFVLTFSRGD